jgi:hypothetical protein
LVFRISDIDGHYYFEEHYFSVCRTELWNSVMSFRIVSPELWNGVMSFRVVSPELWNGVMSFRVMSPELWNGVMSFRVMSPELWNSVMSFRVMSPELWNSVMSFRVMSPELWNGIMSFRVTSPELWNSVMSFRVTSPELLRGQTTFLLFHTDVFSPIVKERDAKVQASPSPHKTPWREWPKMWRERLFSFASVLGIGCHKALRRPWGAELRTLGKIGTGRAQRREGPTPRRGRSKWHRHRSS